MQLMVQQNKKQIIIDLPKDIASDRPFSVKVDDLECQAMWNQQLGLLTITVDGKSYNLKARSFRTSRMADESEVEAKLEWYCYETGTVCLDDYTIDHHVPGAANRRAAAACAGKNMRSPMTGKVIAVDVAEGQEVAKGQTVLIIEAMKMENKIAAPTSGIVKGLKVSAGQSVTVGSDLCAIMPE